MAGAGTLGGTPPNPPQPWTQYWLMVVTESLAASLLLWENSYVPRLLCGQVCLNAEALKGVQSNPESTPPLSKHPRGCSHGCGRVAFRTIMQQGESRCPSRCPACSSLPGLISSVLRLPEGASLAACSSVRPAPRPHPRRCTVSLHLHLLGSQWVNILRGAGEWGGPGGGPAEESALACCLHTLSFVREQRAEVPGLTPCSVQGPLLPACGRLSATQEVLGMSPLPAAEGGLRQE